MTAHSLVDTHCHLNFHKYAHDCAQVLRRAAEAGVERIIVPAIDLVSCEEVLALAERHLGIFVAVGIHPNNIDSFDQAVLQRLRAFSNHRKVVAIGEIGLDYYWDKHPRKMQQQVFETQLNLAAQLELPVIIHNREASDDVLAVLEAWASTLQDSMRQRPGVLHSFSASADHAERALSLGFYLGFTGPLTFKKADELREIAKIVPRDRLLIETDGPFLTPVPYRGKRNEPAYVRYISDKLAELHCISSAEMNRQTTANAEQLFALPKTAHFHSLDA